MQEDWIQKRWRPVMGWTYMVTCITDFIIFPLLWSLLQALQGGQVTSQWNPITLQGAGLFHLAMGAVLGVAAWSRGQEKLAGVTNTPASYNPYMPAGYYETGYTSQEPIMGRVFVSKQGKPGPVYEEPLL